MPAHPDWTSLNRAILDGLDVEAEYRILGICTSGRPSSSGWLSCHVYGVDDRNPSAGINVGDEHPQRGRYKEFTGEGRNVSLFAFASEVAGKFGSWQEARAHYAKIAGVKLPGGKQRVPPVDQFAWRPWNDQIVRGWCHHKQPITVEAVRLAGGRVAGWPRESQKYTVIVLPTFGVNGLNEDPIGYTFYNRSGRPLMQYQGPGKPREPRKVLTCGTTGWCNAAGLAALEEAEIVWKVEGPTDALAVQTVLQNLPESERKRHAAITNTNGAEQVLARSLLNMLADKAVRIIHDADLGGQRGAASWGTALAPIAAEVRIVKLPYKVREKKGLDLRDWFLEVSDNGGKRGKLKLADTSTSPAHGFGSHRKPTWKKRY